MAGIEVLPPARRAWTGLNKLDGGPVRNLYWGHAVTSWGLGVFRLAGVSPWRKLNTPPVPQVVFLGSRCPKRTEAQVPQPPPAGGTGQGVPPEQLLAGAVEKHTGIEGCRMLQ